MPQINDNIKHYRMLINIYTSLTNFLQLIYIHKQKHQVCTPSHSQDFAITEKCESPPCKPSRGDVDAPAGCPSLLLLTPYWGTNVGRHPMQPHMHPEDSHATPHTLGPWLGPICSYAPQAAAGPHARRPGDTLGQCLVVSSEGHCSWPHLSQHLLQVSVLLHCISSWLLYSRSLFVILWLLLHLADGVMKFLLSILNLGKTLKWFSVSHQTHIQAHVPILSAIGFENILLKVGQVGTLLTNIIVQFSNFEQTNK